MSDYNYLGDAFSTILNNNIFSFFFFSDASNIGFLCVAPAILNLASVDQAGKKHQDPPVSVSQMLELKALPPPPCGF